LFFAAIFGRHSASMSASATAMYEGNIKGFRISDDNAGNQSSKLLPFAMHVSTWGPITQGVGPDVWRYDPATKSVVAGVDGIKEAKLMGGKALAPANFGTVNIGNPNNSTADITRQILHGPSKSDFDFHGGSLELGGDGTVILNGDPGLSVGYRKALESIIGQPRIIPLYTSLSGAGAKAIYTVVGFAGVTITSVRLVGPDKQVIVQPEFVVDAGAIPGNDGTDVHGFVFQPLQLVR